MECARCGQLVAGDIEVKLEIIDVAELEGLEFNGELCPTCAHSIIEFVQAGGRDEKPMNAS